MRPVLVLGAAAAAGARNVNLTLYRITPRNYSTLENKNTGDAAGDTYFGIFKIGSPAVCHGGAGACTTVTSIPGFNVFSEFHVEADDRFGPYAACNPGKHGGPFECASMGGSGCWHNSTAHPEWRTQFAAYCSLSECHCDVFSKVVGFKYINDSASGGGGKPPPGYPKSCSAIMQAWGHYVFPKGRNGTKFIKEVDGVDQADCCAACDALQPPSVPDSGACGLATYYAAERRCVLSVLDYTKAGAPDTDPAAYSSYYQGRMTPAGAAVQQGFRYLSGVLMPAAWYSTPAAGQCRDGEEVGRDCWWRVASLGRTVNASCVDDRLTRSIVSRNQSCFDACPDPRDITQECFIKCYFDIVTGNGTTPGITRGDALVPFQSAFKSEDEGGCPTVPPCKDPCLPACWAVPKGDRCDPSL